MKKLAFKTQELPSFVHALLQVFEGSLRDVRFPDADGEALKGAVTAYQTAQATVASAEMNLQSARTHLNEADTALARMSQRALSYARIYAQENPELLASLPVAKSVVGRNGAPHSKGEPALATTREPRKRREEPNSAAAE
jgi:hypothetical protein